MLRSTPAWGHPLQPAAHNAFHAPWTKRLRLTDIKKNGSPECGSGIGKTFGQSLSESDINIQPLRFSLFTYSLLVCKRQKTHRNILPEGNETQSFARERWKSSQISITKYRFSISLIIRNFEGKVP